MAELFGLNFNYGQIGGFIGIAVFLFIIFWVSKFSSEHRAEYGTRKERNLEFKEGFGKFYRAYRGLTNFSGQGIKGAKNIFNRLKAESALEKKEGASKGEQAVNKSAQEAAQAVRAKEKVDQATSALEGREVGLLASVKSILESISAYVAMERPALQNEESDLRNLEALEERLDSAHNFNSMDIRVRGYLKQLFNAIAQTISASVQHEGEKQKQQAAFLKQFKDAVAEGMEVIGSAKCALSMLNSAKRKERRRFGNELKDISNVIKQKQNELNQLKRSKETPRQQIAQSQGEINSLNGNKRFLSKLDNTLKSVYRTTDNGLRAMKDFLRAISRREKKMQQYGEDAGNRERDVEKRHRTLIYFAREAESSIGKTPNPYELAKEFSGKINVFYKQYSSIVSGDLEFDKKIKDSLRLNVSMSMQLEACDTIAMSLDQAEESTEKALASASEIIASTLRGQDQKNELNNLVSNINKAGGDTNYRTRVDGVLRQITRNIEFQLRNIAGQVQGLITEDNRLLQEINSAYNHHSGSIGSTMAMTDTMKMNIDGSYVSKANRFAQEFQQSNKIAAQRYREGTNLGNRARSAVPV